MPRLVFLFCFFFLHFCSKPLKVTSRWTYSGTPVLENYVLGQFIMLKNCTKLTTVCYENLLLFSFLKYINLKCNTFILIVSLVTARAVRICPNPMGPLILLLKHMLFYLFAATDPKGRQLMKYYCYKLKIKQRFFKRLRSWFFL